jgi:hypothetical protein
MADILNERQDRPDRALSLFLDTVVCYLVDFDGDVQDQLKELGYNDDGTPYVAQLAAEVGDGWQANRQYPGPRDAAEDHYAASPGVRDAADAYQPHVVVLTPGQYKIVDGGDGPGDDTPTAPIQRYDVDGQLVVD